MKETKLTISNKTHKVDLPVLEDLPGSDVGNTLIKVVAYNTITRQLALANMSAGGVDDTPFAGERVITRPIPGLQGTVLHGSTVGEVLQNLLESFYPAVGPTGSISVSTPNRLFGASGITMVYFNIYPGSNPVQFQTINGTDIDLDLDAGSIQTGTPSNTNTTFTLFISDGNLDFSTSASVSYYHNRYWFPSSDNLLALSDEDLSVYLNSVISHEFATSRAQPLRQWTLNDEYVYFAYLDSYGAATIEVNGLLNSAYQQRSFTFANEFGYEATFRLYRSSARGLGTIKVLLQ